MSNDLKIPLTIKPAPPRAGRKQLGEDKMARNTAQFDGDAPKLRKPPWIRVRLPSGNAVGDLKDQLRAKSLVTVCEEASCPNIHECFIKGTATFMVLGDICTRRCSFCDVAHGRPKPPDASEPAKLAVIIVTDEPDTDLRARVFLKDMMSPGTEFLLHRRELVPGGNRQATGGSSRCGRRRCCERAGRVQGP